MSEETELAKLIDAHLKRRDWSNRTLAMYADISPSTLTNWLHGRVQPSTEGLSKIGKVLDIDVAVLLGLAGHLDDERKPLGDDRVIELAQRLEALPTELREVAIKLLTAQLNAMDDLAEQLELYYEAKRLFPELLDQAEREEDASETGERVADREPLDER